VGCASWGGGGGGHWSSGRVQVDQVDCVRDIFILNEMWVHGKIYVLISTLLG
jgi:hypothetical protein